ncbi:MAG: hypothetical protein JRF25_00250 [Deltaproteobacteria bacterium]|nr:hypothetical protein [Deltaproteobacteria bacterium]
MALTPETIDKILDINKAERFSLGEQEYSTKKLFPILLPLPYQPETLYINTLTGLADYVEEKIDKTKDPVFCILNHTVVQLISHLDNDKRREIYIEARMDLAAFKFGVQFDPETFIINLQSQFKDIQPLDAKERILDFLTTINSSEIKKYVDDGVSQTLHIKAGLTSGSDETAPVSVPAGPLLLKPYRTFREVDQPESNFIFRMHKGNDGKPTAVLYEADGEAWTLAAIQNIKEWLERNTAGVPVIA